MACGAHGGLVADSEQRFGNQSSLQVVQCACPETVGSEFRVTMKTNRRKHVPHTPQIRSKAMWEDGGYFWGASYLIRPFHSTDFSKNLFLWWVWEKTELMQDSTYALSCIWMRKGRKEMARWDWRQGKQSRTRREGWEEHGEGVKVKGTTGETRAAGSMIRNENRDPSLGTTTWLWNTWTHSNGQRSTYQREMKKVVISTGKENNPCGTGLDKLQESSNSIRELQAGFSKAGKDRRNLESLQEVDLNFLQHNWEVLRINKLITYHCPAHK